MSQRREALPDRGVGAGVEVCTHRFQHFGREKVSPAATIYPVQTVGRLVQGFYVLGLI